MLKRLAVVAALLLGSNFPGCGGSQPPASSPTNETPGAEVEPPKFADLPEYAGLSEEDLENVALSDCLGMCDMIFSCRAEIAAAIGEKAAIALMGPTDDMELCHGICFDQIYDIELTCFDCYDLDLPCAEMGACMRERCDY